MSQTEALTRALVLAILAPTEGQATRAVALAESLAVGLTPVQVKRAKAQARRLCSI